MDGNPLRQRINAALSAANDTRVVELGPGAIDAVAEVLRGGFEGSCAAIIADTNTLAAAGRRVAGVLSAAGVRIRETLVLEARGLHAHVDHVDRLERALAAHDAVPIAVGSGTINDLVKLASHRVHRAYLAVATAASMDGYTSFGASVTQAGSKQTFFCPAPRAVIADMDVICAAPPVLNAAGYADLLAKVCAGADWLLADALGVEPVDRRAWELVQPELRQWLDHPEGIRLGQPADLERLTAGLLMTGFAMQCSRSSRPASGADHQFSHLWDMQHHEHQGQTPLHGYKVGIGTLASARLYEQLLAQPLEALDVADACRRWPSAEELQCQVGQSHALDELRTVAMKESLAKYLDRAALAQRLERLKAIWPELRESLRAQLIPSAALREMLRQAGAPVEPSEIGISLARLRRSYLEAQQIRRRYTVLDLAVETGLMATCLERMFAPAGPWLAAEARIPDDA